ncbi:MAG: cell division protein FtsA [Clostridia bacterium]|nr:cell division protein FtsA [Clostridia bacterium]
MEELTLAVGDIIVGMDIGTSKVSLVIGEVNNFGQIETLCSTSNICNGIKKGKIIDEEDVIKTVIKTLEDAESESNLKINSAYITIYGKDVTIVQNSITKEIKDRYVGITAKDISSAIMQAKDIDVPEGKAIIDIVADKFVLDDGKVTSDPIGSFCSSFTLKAQIVLANKEYIRQIHNIFRKADLEIDGIVPITLAEKNVILDTNEMNDSVMILDIGAGNTEIGVFEGSEFIYTNTIPLGGDNITNDIALVLNITQDEADKLKKQYGLAMKSYIDNDNDITLNTCKDENRNKVIKSSELIEIIEARVEEIFKLINDDITMQGVKSKINSVVLTGQGIVNISKSDVAGKVILNIPVKISTGRMVSTIRPGYRTAYALVRYVASRQYAKNVSSSIDTNKEKSAVKVILEKIKDFFYS